jgi:hypothetical protein
LKTTKKPPIRELASISAIRLYYNLNDRLMNAML